MRQTLAFDPAARLGQHFFRDVDAGHARIVPEIGQGQAGPDPDFEDALSRPLVDEAHRLLAAGMKNRAENKIVRSGKQPIGPDRIAQVHRIFPVVIDEAVAVSCRQQRKCARPPIL
jgi:hypothetical protein